MSFTRFAGVAAVLLSLGFLATALPAVVNDSVPAITGTDAVSSVCAQAFVEIEACIKALVGCGDYDALVVQIKVLIALFVKLTAELVKIGAGVHVAVDAKLSIVACISATISLCVKVLIQLTVKLGLDVVIKACVDLDVCLKAFLEAIEVCIPGICALIFVAIKVVIDLCIKLQLRLCLSVLGLTL